MEYLNLDSIAARELGRAIKCAINFLVHPRLIERSSSWDSLLLFPISIYAEISTNNSIATPNFLRHVHKHTEFIWHAYYDMAPPILIDHVYKNTQIIGHGYYYVTLPLTPRIFWLCPLTVPWRRPLSWITPINLAYCY